jgi:hypothetical protein
MQVALIGFLAEFGWGQVVQLGPGDVHVGGLVVRVERDRHHLAVLMVSEPQPGSGLTWKFL